MKHDEFELDHESDQIIDRGRRIVQSKDIDALSMMMKIFGTLVTLLSLPFLFVPVLRWIALIFLLVGMAYLTFGFGFGAYKRWAWWGSVVLLLPLSLIFSVVGFLTYASGVVHGPFTIFPAICTLTIFYVAWVLFSQGGRKRYVETVEAYERAKGEPESVAGQALIRNRQAAKQNTLWGVGMAFAMGGGLALICVILEANHSEPPPPEQTDPPEAIAALSKIADRVRYDFGGNVRNILFTDQPDLTDDDLRPLGQLTAVLQVKLDGTGITDETLKRLSSLKTLKYVSVANTGISDEGVAHLTSLPLETLDLEGTSVTDASIAHISQMASLEKLILRDTGITSDVLPDLKQLRRLRRLDVRDTRVSKEAVRDFKESLTWCRVYENAEDLIELELPPDP